MTKAFVLASGMAFLAGATDVYGLASLGNLYVSFMSGNTTMLGVSLGSGDLARSASIAALIGLFVLGAAGGAVLANLSGRSHTPSILLIVSALLCVPLVFPNGMVFAVVVAMGILNAAMSKVGATSISLTYVTGTLVKIGQGLGNSVSGHHDHRSWLLQAPMWMSLLAGSCVAALLRHVGVAQPWPLPLVALMLAALALWPKLRF